MQAWPGFRLRRAAHAIARGGVVAYPTEAVFGIGCDPDDPRAVERVLALKERPWHKGLIVIAAAAADLLPYLGSVSEEQWRTMTDTWPGAVTWLVPCSNAAPTLVTGASDQIAVRVPGHALARALCRHWGGALVSTSANRAGQWPLRSVTAVRRRFGHRLDDLVPGRLGAHARPSTIRSITTGEVIRPG